LLIGRSGTVPPWRRGLAEAGASTTGTNPEGRESNGRGRAANELTMTIWDPVSKQPVFKSGAVRLVKVADGSAPAPAPAVAASEPV
jgi:hypothetical protein